MTKRSADGEELIGELIEALPVAVYELDLTGRIRFTNSAYSAITGYSVDELRGMPVHELMAPGPERDGFPAFFEQLVAETPVPFPVAAENITRDGRHIHVGIVWNYRRDAEGRVAGFACVLTEITEQVAAERELRLSEERFRSMFDQSPRGTVVYSPDGKPLYVNPVQRVLMGLSEEEMSLALAHYNVLEDPQLVALGVMPYIEKGFSGEPTAVPAALYEPRKMQPFLDHDPIWLRGFVYPLRDSAGEVREVVVTFEDVTAAKQAEELESRIQQAQKLESLSVLAGGIAHDFNNLLVAILGNADLALVDLPPESPTRGLLEDIVTASTSAADLVRQMLAYSGQSQIAKEMLDVTKLVEEISQLLETAISKKATLRYDLASDLPAVEGDASQLRQIVLNLIINASEALVGDGGIISIRTGAGERDASYLAESYLGDELH